MSRALIRTPVPNETDPALRNARPDQMAPSLGGKLALPHHIGKKRLGILRGKFAQLVEGEATSRNGVIVARDPPHLNSLRPFGRLDVPILWYLDQRQPNGIGRKVAQNPKNGWQRRFVPSQQIEITCLWKIKTASLINQRNLLTGAGLLSPRPCRTFVPVSHEIDVHLS